MKKKIYFIPLTLSLLSLFSCYHKDGPTCLAVDAREVNKSVRSQVLFDDEKNLYYIKSLEQGENRHFINQITDSTTIYDNNKFVRRERDEDLFQELLKRAVDASEVYVDFQRRYCPCKDENGKAFISYASYYFEPVYEDYTIANPVCIYFEKMGEEFYNSSNYDGSYGRFSH